MKTKTDIVKLEAKHLGIPVIDLPLENEIDELVVKLKHYLEDMPEAGDEDRFYSDSEIKRLERNKAMIAQTIMVLLAERLLQAAKEPVLHENDVYFVGDEDEI